MVIGYVRMSTGRQDRQSQEQQIYKYAAEKGVKIDRIEVETISTKVKRKDRRISQIVENLKPGDRLIVSELSRLGRTSITEVGSIIEDLNDRGAGLSVVHDGIEIEPGGEMDVRSQAILSAILLASRIERDLISERTSAALQARKAAGQVLGRPKGSKLDNQVDEIKKYMDLGLSKTAIAKLLGISRSALYAWMARNA